MPQGLGQMAAAPCGFPNLMHSSLGQMLLFLEPTVLFLFFFLKSADHSVALFIIYLSASLTRPGAAACPQGPAMSGTL